MPYSRFHLFVTEGYRGVVNHGFPFGDKKHGSASDLPAAAADDGRSRGIVDTGPASCIYISFDTTDSLQPL
jgi:hypothetical protein